MAKKKARKVSKPKTTPVTAPVAAPEPALVTVPEQAPTEAPKEATSVPTHHKPSPMTVGVWAYVIGILVALFAAVYVNTGLAFYTYTVLAVLGFMVALINITEDETLLFLVATVAFVISANSVRGLLPSDSIAGQFLTNFVVFTAASAFLVSMKAIIKVAKSE